MGTRKYKPVKTTTKKNKKKLELHEVLTFMDQERWLPESDGTVSMTNSQLLRRFMGRRRDWVDFSEAEQAALALIYRLQQDFEKPIRKLKEYLNFIKPIASYKKDDGLQPDDASYIKKERKILVNRFLSEVVGVRSGAGKLARFDDNELVRIYYRYLTGGFWFFLDREPKPDNIMSPKEARDETANVTGLSPHVVYKRLTKAGIKGVPSDNYDK